jgi:subtilisin family serine protease
MGLALAGAAQAQTHSNRSASGLALPAPVKSSTAPAVRSKQTGKVQVVVRLTDPPLALMVGANAKRTGSTLSPSARAAYMATLKSKQDAVMAGIRGLGGKEVARVGKAYNALVISVDASKLPQIARLAGVSALRPVINPQRSLETTVPYVGAKALQDLGVTGTGVKIAILDSGIDYTHYNLGGSGQLSDFNTAATNATTVPGGLYPTAKVIGGYDYVGEVWPNGSLAPDANPIDAGVGSGHGTHVADIAAGASKDGLHKGMAPGALLYAVKVCSSVTTSCSGTAILQGLDWAMDPKGDLSFDGAADVVNLSLGANYGQRENPATEAVSNVARFGIVVVASAGNGGDRPYILGSPSNAPEAISVAQTTMPGDSALPLVVSAPAAIAGIYSNTATVDWAPIVAGFGGAVRVAGSSGSPAAIACTPETTIDFTGTVALIDRGTCAVSLKVANAAVKGALGVIIANNAPGDAPSFSYGGGEPLVQTLVVTQSTGALLRSVPSGTAIVSVSNANGIALVGSMASTSSRGPGYNFAAIKPEIGAPGASVSAINGTGNGTGSFGGTSGAAPVVSGSAALLLQKFPTAAPADIKARLMNAAYTQIYTNPATVPGELAPITRIGSGEVRVDRAASINATVYDATNPANVGLSFGTLRTSANATLSKKVAVRNFTSSQRTYTIARSFRYADDAASTAVTLTAPASITVPANGTAAFALTLAIDPLKLPDWNLWFSGDQGTGALLQGVEFDGYLTLTSGSEVISVPWHVLPHKAANLVPGTTSLVLGTSAALPVSNVGGAAFSYTQAFALTGTSPKMTGTLPPYGGGQVLIDLKAVGVRSTSDGAVQFGIATYGERAHPAYPAEFDVYVDSNADGVDDYVLYTAENGGFGVTGQTLVYVYNISTGVSTAYYYADADLNSSNMILTAPAAAIGITSPTQAFRFTVYSFDNYFTGSLTDSVATMTYTLGTPKYKLNIDTFSLAPGTSGALSVTAPSGGATASPSQTGLLLLHSDAKTGRESDTITVTK